jgi:hypothetical protein
VVALLFFMCLSRSIGKPRANPPLSFYPTEDRNRTSCYEYVPLDINTFRSFLHSWLVTMFVTRVIRLMPLVEQELPTLPDHLSSHPVLSGVRVTRSLVLCVMFCRSLFFLLSFFVCPFSCLSFFDLRNLITSSVSSNSSYGSINNYTTVMFRYLDIVYIGFEIISCYIGTCTFQDWHCVFHHRKPVGQWSNVKR